MWQEWRCSRAWSVMRGQLSSSRTERCSVEHAEVPRCRMPSSVISSQWERLWGVEKGGGVRLIPLVVWVIGCVGYEEEGEM